VTGRKDQFYKPEMLDGLMDMCKM